MDFIQENHSEIYKDSALISDFRKYTLFSRIDRQTIVSLTKIPSKTSQP